MSFKASAFDKQEDGEVVQAPGSTPRPKDAATLILVRHDAASPRVLMGKRSGRHSFMPDKYVFPGGRVDPQDGRVTAYRELENGEAARLRVQARRRPRAFALCAIRETFEETGLLIGRNMEMPAHAPAGWQALYDRDIAPDLGPLVFIGRAITPPYRPKRFDARFFMASAEEVLVDDRPPLDGAELSDLQWVALEDTKDLDLPRVTQFMLEEISARLSHKQPAKPPFVRWVRGRHQIDRIEAV